MFEPVWGRTAVLDPELEFNISHLVNFSYQVCRGMEFLASKKVSKIIVPGFVLPRFCAFFVLVVQEQVCRDISWEIIIFPSLCD